MATAEIAPLVRPQVAAGEGEGGGRDWRLVAAAGAVGLACAPWLAEHARVLWVEAPHYRFLPIVPVVAAALAVRGSRGLGALTRGSGPVTFGLLAAAWAVAAVADVMYSPAMGMVSALTALAALAHGLGGLRLLRAMAPAGLVLGLAVRPPLRLDYELMYRMQTLATDCSSRSLDLLGVCHLRAGHVLEVPGRRLFVEQACSGITSLSVVLAVTLCAALWLRRVWPETAMLLGAAAAWVLLGNVARITGEVYALTVWGVDVTGGARHETLGMLVLAAVLGLVLSTDQLIARVVAAVRRSRVRHAHLMRGESIEAAETAADEAAAARPSAGGGWAQGGPTRWPAARTTWVGSWPVVVAFLALAAANAASARGGLEYSSPGLSRGLATLAAGDMPAVWSGLRRESFEADGAPLGASSRRWRYRPAGGGGGANLTVVVQHPYLGWHDVVDCYKAQGWVIESRRVVAADRVVAHMRLPLEGPGLLVFGLDDAGGSAFPPPSGAGWRAVLVERLSQAAWRLRGTALGPVRGAAPTYMVQVLAEGGAGGPLSAAEEGRALALFGHARGLVRERVRARAGGGGR